MKIEKIFIIIFASLSFLIYLPSLNGSFLFDDNHMIVNNTFIKNPKYFPLFFKGYVTSYPIPKGMCRPLLMLSFAFNYWGGGLNPVGYRIINVLLHFLNATLLYFLLTSLKKDTPKTLAFLIILLFLVHPINTEAVSYISSRSDLMVTFFILGGFLLYLKKRYALSCLLYVFSLLTKETGLCFPLLILSYEFIYFIKDYPLSKKDIGKRKFVYIGIVLITLLYLIYKSKVFSSTPARIPRSYYQNILLQSVVTLLYFKLLVLPHSLNIIHYLPEFGSLFHFPVLFSTLGIVGLIILALLFIKKNFLISIGLSWLLIGLLPKFYARLSFPAMEHHFYLSSIGIYIVLISILRRIYLKYTKYFTYFVIGIISILASFTLIRSYEYRNPLVFWKISAQRNPKSATILNQLGLVYLKMGATFQAEKEFIKAINTADRIESIVNARGNLAHIYIKQRKYEKALKLINDATKSVKIPPMGSYNLLGIIYSKMGKKKKAEEAWLRELQLYPASVEAGCNLAFFYLKEGNLFKAKEMFKKAIQINPTYYGGYYGLAQIFQEKNNYKKAIEMYKKSIYFNPKHRNSHYYLGTLYARIGDGRALSEFKKVISIDPSFAPAYNDLAVVYASLIPPRWDLARKYALIAKSLGFRVDNEFLKIIEDNLRKSEK